MWGYTTKLQHSGDSCHYLSRIPTKRPTRGGSAFFRRLPSAWLDTRYAASQLRGKKLFEYSLNSFQIKLSGFILLAVAVI